MPRMKSQGILNMRVPVFPIVSAGVLRVLMDDAVLFKMTVKSRTRR